MIATGRWETLRTGSSLIGRPLREERFYVAHFFEPFEPQQCGGRRDPRWMKAQGWNDVLLDLDAERDLVAGIAGRLR
jgi:hypothetical protein